MKFKMIKKKKKKMHTHRPFFNFPSPYLSPPDDLQETRKARQNLETRLGTPSRTEKKPLR